MFGFNNWNINLVMFKSTANINNGIIRKNVCAAYFAHTKENALRENKLHFWHTGRDFGDPQVCKHLLQKNNTKKGFVMWSRAINGLKIMMYIFHSWCFCFSKINCFSDISVIMYPSNFPIAKKLTNNPLLLCEGYGSAILWNFSECTAASGRGWS